MNVEEYIGSLFYFPNEVGWGGVPQMARLEETRPFEAMGSAHLPLADGTAPFLLKLPAESSMAM